MFLMCVSEIFEETVNPSSVIHVHLCDQFNSSDTKQLVYILPPAQLEINLVHLIQVLPNHVLHGHIKMCFALGLRREKLKLQNLDFGINFF